MIGQGSDAAPERRGPDRLRLFRPLASRNFFLLWLGESVAVFGRQFEMLAMNWVVLDVLGESGLVLGTIAMATAIPLAVFMLFGGVVSDRLSPRRVMLVSNASRCVLVGGLTYLVFAHTDGSYTLELWHLYVFAVIFGTVGAFFLPAMMAMTPRLLDRGKLEAGNALLMGTAQLGGLVGPAAAGILVATAGTAAALSVNVAAFAVATVTLLLMRGVGPEVRPAPSDEGLPAQDVKRDSVLADIRNGIRYAWSHAGIRALLPVVLVVNLCFAGPMMVGLPWLIHDLTGEATALGSVMSVVMGSSLVGTLLAGMVRPRRRGLVLAVLEVVLGIGLILLGWAGDVVTISILVGVNGLANGIANVMMVSWFQREIRSDMRGRVMSVVMFAAFGLQPLSLALAGWLIDVNPAIMFAGAGGLMLLTGLYLVSNRDARAID